MAAPIGVEGREQAVRCDHLLQPHKARSRALLLDQDGREDGARGIVHRDNKVEFRPLRQPRVLRAVLEEKRPGREASWKRSVLEEKRPGREASWKRSVLEEKRPGREASWKRSMPGSGRRARFLRWAERLGALLTSPRNCSTLLVQV